MKQIVFHPEVTQRMQVRCLLAYGYDINANEVPIPDAEKIQLGPALLVDYETPIEQQCKLLGIKNWLYLSSHKDLFLRPEGRWGWKYGVENGKKMLGKSAISAVEEFRQNNRRGLMTVEGLALRRENSNLPDDYDIYLSASRYEEHGDHVPTLILSDGSPTLYSYDADYSNPKLGSASCLLNQ